MEILPRCHAQGSYGYTATTNKLETVSIKNADELYAAVPLGAAKLEGKLQQAGELSVSMTFVGRYALDKLELARDKLTGQCDKATHLIAAMTAGAFELATVASAQVGAKADVVGTGAGASSESAREVLNRDGDPRACADSASSADKPPAGCGALLRVEVEPLEGFLRGKSAQTLKVRPEGVSKIHIDSNVPTLLLVRRDPTGLMHEPVCRAPCDEWVDGRQGELFQLRESDDWVGPEFRLQQLPAEVAITATRTSKKNDIMHISSWVAMAVGAIGILGGAFNLAKLGEDEERVPYYVGFGFGIGVPAAVTGVLLFLNYDAEYDLENIPGSSP